MNGRQLGLRLGSGLVGLTAVAATALAGAAPASAAGILPTTTTATATPSTVSGVTGGTVKLTATVGPLDLLITPSGTVRFTVFAPGSAIGVNTAPVKLSRCLILLSTCTASKVILADGPPGTYTVVAHYSGDLLSAASAGTTAFTITAVGTTGT